LGKGRGAEELHKLAKNVERLNPDRRVNPPPTPSPLGKGRGAVELHKIAKIVER
jgi:hypothetical protein